VVPFSDAMARDRQFKLVLTDEEHEMLMKLAETTGMSAATILRQHIRQQHAKLCGEAKPRRPKKEKRLL